MQVRSQQLRHEVDILQRADEYVAQGDDVFMLDVFQQLQLSVGSFAEDWGGEGFKDLLDRDGVAGESVLG